jgi:ABC-type Fe3+ transport system substrate-binding protein
MTDPVKHPPGIPRRILLGAASALAIPGLPAAADEPTPVDTMIVNAVVSGALKDIIQAQDDCIINDAPFQTTTDVIARLNSPGGTSRYDLMGSTFEFSEQPVLGVPAGHERVLPLDLSLIPNFSQIVDVALPGIGKKDGKVYMIPYCWGFDSVVFNKDHVPEDDPYTQSWGMLFEDKYAGRIGWYDVALTTISAAALYLGHPEPTKMDNGELAEVIRFLAAKKKNVRAFYTTFAPGISMLLSEEIYCAYGTLPIRAQLAQKGFNVGYAFPKEGVMSLTNTVYVPKDAKHPIAAQKVINTMLSKEYAAQLSKVSGYLSTSKFAPEVLSAEERKTYGYGVLDGSVKHVGEFFPQNMNQWLEGWARVKSA